jgi:hypothetical protein
MWLPIKIFILCAAMPDQPMQCANFVNEIQFEGGILTAKVALHIERTRQMRSIMICVKCISRHAA